MPASQRVKRSVPALSSHSRKQAALKTVKTLGMTNPCIGLQNCQKTKKADYNKTSINADNNKTNLEIRIVPLSHLLQQMLVLCLHIFICFTNGLQENNKSIEKKTIRQKKGEMYCKILRNQFCSWLWDSKSKRKILKTLGYPNFCYVYLWFCVFICNSLSKLQNIPVEKLKA